MNRSRAIAIADRAATLSLRLILALNLLFLISFLLLIAFAAGSARAEAPACKGRDMLAALEKSDPALLAKIGREAAATPNGEGLLWTLEKPGAKASFLFGTMHMTDPRVTDLTPAARDAFEGADTVVIETTEILDQTKMMATIAAQPELTMFTDGTTLTSLLSPDDASMVTRELGERGIPIAAVARMKPWMLSAMIALPACELARKAQGAPVLDVRLAEDALAADKSLEGLETVADQLQAMASLPMEFHMKGLVETLKLGDRIDDVIETMIVLYEHEDTGMFWPLFRAVLPAGNDDSAGYAAFEEAMISSRNRTMAANAVPILNRGNAFIAVGALHLPGEKGLIELFREDGYTVTAVN
ncbi:MAG: TraB/GumN family protein [Alphaproteobacteria bacterium]|nr:TraB/GumN family protein [Alphaproteobacteria bacterium]MBU0805232.1 TraB/GumN family protein [Alphaproteobacteria bacterium]MBU0870731.1 TraB/GumN family protein [Alphaproteobacteria bacterium]MBU1401594.1 TraB/GumN family protein [Alphaproteobacteria bacterium]MBU1591989.1 TraB/GumN family protein [Alphaproteobacteria bacterium]